MKRILFVCTGNICRSPTADGIFRKLVLDAGLTDHIESDSAGTHDYHVGEAPDPRTQAAALARGYDLSGLRARQVARDDMERFDLILAMDRSHHAYLNRLAPMSGRGKLRMMLEYAREAGVLDVPDPYYGGPRGFEDVLDLLEDASRGLLEALRADSTRA